MILVEKNVWSFLVEKMGSPPKFEFPKLNHMTIEGIERDFFMQV